MSEPFPCKDCKQLIIYHEGREVVVNFHDGIGGQRGTRHICPQRMGTDPHHKESHKQLATPFPKIRASVILCPYPDCSKACVQNEDYDCVDIFAEHCKEYHDMTPTNFIIGKLKNKIELTRVVSRLHYTDPFLAVSLEDITRENWANK